MSRPGGSPDFQGPGPVPSAGEIFASRRPRGPRRGRPLAGAGGEAASAPPPFDYLAAAARLKGDRRSIAAAFARPLEHPCGCLFHFCSPDRRCHRLHEHGLTVGCPVQVSGRTHFVAWGREATRRILALGLPTLASRLTDDQLDDIADLQTEMDLTFRRKQWREEHPEAMVAPWPADRVADDASADDWF